jgi:hypothetical protein
LHTIQLLNLENFDTARGARREPAAVRFGTATVVPGIPASVSRIVVPVHWKRAVTWFDGNIVTSFQEQRQWRKAVRLLNVFGMTWEWWNHDLLDPGFMTWPTLGPPCHLQIASNCNVSGEAGGSSAQTRTIDPSVGPRCGTNPLFIGDRYRSILKFFEPPRVGFEITFDMFNVWRCETSLAHVVWRQAICWH